MPFATPMSQAASRVRCCVLGCSATYQSTDQSGEKVRFFGFPARPHDVERRNKWIDNIRIARRDVDGIWSPSKNSKVCSRHFVGNVKVEDPREANYNPTVFPTVSKKTAQKYNRIYTAKAEQKEQPKSGRTSPKSTEGPGTRLQLSRDGKTKEYSSPAFNAATTEAPGGTTMEGQRTVHLASVVDGDANLDGGVHVTLDDFLREWSVDPHPKYVTPKCQESGPNDDAAAATASTTAQADGCKEPAGKGRAFQCPICGDRYISSRSLRRHLSRRSFLARLPCRKCGACHLAFNRCTLIMRAQGCQIGANVATLSALPPGETLVPVELSEEGDGSPQQTDVPMTVLEKVLQSVVCSECYTNLDDDAFREDHFQPSRGNLLRCSSCPMLCTSECALRAHRRLHAQRRPYVCPECGMRCEGEWSVFHQHVSRHCHHYERIVGYHCQLCPALLLDKAELAGHVVDTHSSALHKCQACPMAFVTLESFQMHRQATHPKLRPQCWLILKCPLCEAVFASSELLASHAASCHLDQCGRSLFKCATCDSLQPTRSDLVAHLRNLHPDMHQTYPWGHKEDKGSLVPAAAAAAAGKKRPAKGEVINLDDDETPEADKMGDGAGPSSSKVVQPKRKVPGSPAPLAGSKNAAQKSMQGTFKNAEAGQAASNSAKAAASAAEHQSPEKQPSSAKVCAKCSFESSDASAFRDHIKAHKPANQETFQCPECGLCYVVEPSLRKHLRGVHRVDKAEVKQGGVVAAGSNVGVAAKDDDGLRCSVCLATFDTERELKSHTRSHGMAFLKKVKAKDGTV